MMVVLGHGWCRYSAIVVDNVIKAFNEEPDGTGASCSLANKALEDLKALA